MSTMKNFDSFLNNLTETINKSTYYVDFESIYKKLDGINVSDLIFENQKLIPLLMATTKPMLFNDDTMLGMYDFKNKEYSKDEIETFIEKTGLKSALDNIKSIKDYIFGVLVGMSTNARKNRSGHQMEDLVEEYIKKSGNTYHKEMYVEDVEKLYNVDLSPITSNNTTTKRWDFVIKGKDNIYCVETNFYSSSGSKLNETARSYKLISEKIKNINGVKFVWITDGYGWKIARRNLKETYDVMEHLYNINDIKNGVLMTL